MSILDYIPFGAESAITREELERATGLPDSTNRILISAAKMDTPIVSTCRHKGYFRPRADRPEEVRMAKECREELRKKALTMLAQLKALDNFINPSGQMSLFEEAL